MTAVDLSILKLQYRGILTRLLILWLLSESPLHGYRIKKILEDEGLGFFFPIEYASIYSALRTLVKEGHVEQVAVEREGNRERTRYRITRSGRRHFEELLRRAWRELPSPAEPIQLALAARPELAEDEVDQLLDERRDALRARSPSSNARGGRRPPRKWSPAGARSPSLSSPGSKHGGRDMTEKQPDVQVISNLVVRDDGGRVLLVRYDADDERWWLPGPTSSPTNTRTRRPPRSLPNTRASPCERSRRWRSWSRSAADGAGT